MRRISILLSMLLIAITAVSDKGFFGSHRKRTIPSFVSYNFCSRLITPCGDVVITNQATATQACIDSSNGCTVTFAYGRICNLISLSVGAQLYDSFSPYAPATITGWY